MSLVGEVIDRILNVWLLGTYSTQYNQLGADLNVGDTEFTCAFPLGEISVGSIVAIDDELLYVVDRDTTNNRLICARGVRGTVVGFHGAGRPIEINPRFPRLSVKTMMEREINSWPDSLYAVQSFTADLAVNVGLIDVPSDIHGYEPRYVLQVRRRSLSIIDDRFRRTPGWEQQWGLIDSATDIDAIVENPTGQIVLKETVALATSYRVKCACELRSVYISVGENIDLNEDIGLARGMEEILELGVSYRLLMGRGSIRLFPEAEGQSRNAAEVGGQDIPSLATRLYQLRNQAITREAERLVKRHGFGGT